MLWDSASATRHLPDIPSCKAVAMDSRVAMGLGMTMELPISEEAAAGSQMSHVVVGAEYAPVAMLAQSSMQPEQLKTCTALRCPTCGKIRTRRYWCPSQWWAWSAKTDHFHQCKVCDGKLPEDESCSWATWSSRTRTPPPRCVQPHTVHVPPEGVALVQIARSVQRDKFGKFIDDWMTQPHGVRKTLSYSGALHSNKDDPVHYVCKYTGQGYFDPMNKIYSIAMSILAPQLWSRGWNIETRGDIFEGLLGYWYMLEHNECNDVCQVGPQAQCVAIVIEETTRLVYKLNIHTGTAFEEWCAHILANAHCGNDVESARRLLPQLGAIGPSNAPRTKKGFIALCN